MKNWKTILLVAGIMLIAAAFVVYVQHISNCYNAGQDLPQFTLESRMRLREACNLDAPLTVQFGSFLALFLPGVLLFSAYWFLVRPGVGAGREMTLNVFLLFLMFDSLLVMVYGLLIYPALIRENAPTGWPALAIAALGCLSYAGLLAVWHWKRWGVFLFQGAFFTLAMFLFVGGMASGLSIILPAAIVAGAIGLSLMLRPVRNKLV